MTDTLDRDWAAFSAHLDEALERSGEDLDRWLAQLRQKDPALAQRVSDALASRDSAGFGAFLSAPATLLSEAAGASTLRGRRVGPYVVESQIGHGGMGSVWRARRDDGQFDAVVAIKFIHASWIGQAGEQRFRLEGNMLARLMHPNIARLLDAGVFDAAQPYLVLEFVDGETIDAYCDHHRLTMSERLHLFIQALGAVAHAHSHLIIHRDIKPSNILVAIDGSVKLLDFGVAKLLQEGPGDAALTRSRAAALTPQYAAPEQLSDRPVTTATDVYSLGVVLYQLLTGLHPFQSVLERPGDLLRAVTSTAANAASSVAMLDYIDAAALKGDLDNILNKALKKDPGERYATVGAFAEDLQRHLVNQPVLAAPDTLRYRASKFVRRNRGAVAGTVAAALGLLVTTSAALWQTHQARLERDAALAAERRADTVKEFTSLLLRDIGSNDNPNALRQQLDRSQILLREQHYSDPLIRADLLGQLSARYAESGDTTTSIALLEQSLLEMTKAGELLGVAQLHCSIANAYDGLGRNDDSERHIREAVALLDRLGKAVRPEIRADCRIVESYVATAHHQSRRAIAAARKALEEIESAGILSGDQHVTEMNALRRAYARAGQFAQALKVDKAIHAADASATSSESLWSWIHAFNAANTLLGGGRVVDAEARSASLLTTVSRFGEGGENTRDIALLRARILLALNRATEARTLLERARQLHGSNPHIDLAVLLVQAQERLQSGDLASVRQALLDNRGAIEESIRTHEDEGLVALQLRAQLALQSGDAAVADIEATRAMPLVRDADGAQTPEFFDLAALRSEIALVQGDAARAERLAEQAVEQAIRQAVTPESSATIGRGLLLRARCRQALGDASLARRDFQAAFAHLQTNLGAEHPLTRQARALRDAQ